MTKEVALDEVVLQLIELLKEQDPVSLSSLFINPTVLAAILGVLIPTTIISIYRRNLKTKTIMTLISSDLETRVAQLTEFIDALVWLIDKSEAEPHYMPCVFNRGGYSNYINWENEKWLLKLSYASRVLDFYNENCSIYGSVDFTHSESFKALPKNRQLGLYRSILEDSKNLREQGVSLISLLHSHGWKNIK